MHAEREGESKPYRQRERTGREVRGQSVSDIVSQRAVSWGAFGEGVQVQHGESSFEMHTERTQ